ASSTVNVSTVGTYAVTYDATDHAGGHAAPAVRTVHVTDTTPPTVTALGASPALVECATAFVDPGATATDSCAGALSVTVSGAVDVGTPGSYALAYTAADPSGNSAAAARLVTVADSTAPVITVAGANPARVECATAFTDPGASATDSCAGPLPVTASGAANVAVPGSYTIGYTAADPSGNTASASRAVT